MAKYFSHENHHSVPPVRPSLLPTYTNLRSLTMSDPMVCTICGKPSASFCEGCMSAKYCSPECEQTDGQPHQLLCCSYRQMVLTERPSFTHHIGIQFPTHSTQPKLVWVDTEEIEGDPGYFSPKLDELLSVPGNSGYLGRNVHCVRRNMIRGRETNRDTLNIWYIDDPRFRNLYPN